MLSTLAFVIVGIWVAWIFIYSIFIHPVKGKFDKTSQIVWGTLAVIIIAIILWVFSLMQQG